VLSPIVGGVAGRVGARMPMTVGAAIAGVGMLLFTRVQPGAAYVSVILPAVVVFGLGLGILVAPLTAAVLAAAPEELKGTASAFNNAVARCAGLLAVALLPLAAGMTGADAVGGVVLAGGFLRAMYIAAALCFAGAAIAYLTMRTPVE
jgi:hypothetical protein